MVFGTQAEPSAEYLKKGTMVLVEGRMQTRSWEQDGQKRYRTEIIADRVQFGPKKAEREAVDDPEGDSADDVPFS